MNIIWLSLTLAAKLSMDDATSEAVRLLITKISGSAPARSKALAVSYSQLVPGNTGISAFGLAVLTEAEKVLLLAREIASGASPQS